MDVLLIALPVVTMLVVVIRMSFISNGISFEDLLSRTDLAWPRGVQEEEPAPWHVERLRPRARSMTVGTQRTTVRSADRTIGGVASTQHR